MPIPRRDVVQPIIHKHREPIVAAVLGAWDDWLTSPHPGIWRCKRSRANFVWEQIIERAHRAFGGWPSVHIVSGYETFKFLLDDEVLFRFKKGDEAYLSVNVPTQLSLAFHDHDQNLLGLPEVQRVEIVYQLNRLETKIADVIVVARDGDVVVWYDSLLTSAAAATLLPMSIPSGEPATQSTRRLVRPRNSSEVRGRNRRD